MADEFTQKLKSILANQKVGNSQDKSVSISKIIKSSYIDEIIPWLTKEKENLALEGAIEQNKHFVHPSIIKKKSSEHKEDYFHEFFAPIFYVLTYSNQKELEAIIQSKAFTDNAMYASVFGNNARAEMIMKPFVKILKDQIVNDIEVGNSEYGGYGKDSNFTKFKYTIRSGPILISHEIDRHFSNKR